MRNIPIGRIKYLSDNVVRAMISEGLDEHLLYAPSEKRLSDGPNEFAAYRMMNDVEQTWQKILFLSPNSPRQLWVTFSR